jgi:hypothetical protein
MTSSALTGPAGKTGKAPPIYELAVESGGVVCEIRVNDVPVLKIPGGRLETSFDVNPYVVTGMNLLTMIVRPAGGKGEFDSRARCVISLGIRKTPKQEQPDPVTSLTFEPTAQAPTGFENSAGFAQGQAPFLRTLGKTATQPFQLDTPFRPWGWTFTSPIPATEAIRAEVLAQYRLIHGLLQAKDIAALTQLCEEQARDWQIAYGLPDLEAGRKALGIAKTLGDPDVEVEDFPPDVLTMELLGDKKLVQLVDAEGKSPLRLRLKSAKQVLGRFNVVLCRDGNKWVMAR